MNLKLFLWYHILKWTFFFFISWVYFVTSMKTVASFLKCKILCFSCFFLQILFTKTYEWIFSMHKHSNIFWKCKYIEYMYIIMSLYCMVYNQNVFITMLCFVFKRTITTLYSIFYRENIIYLLSVMKYYFGGLLLNLTF